MSILVMSAVWERSRSKGNNLLVLLYLANCAHDDGGTCYPSVERVAHHGRMSERSVQYALKSLEDSGELTIEYGTGPKGTNNYTILLDQLGQSGGAKSAPVQNTTKGGAKSAPKPLTEPSVNNTSTPRILNDDTDPVTNHPARERKPARAKRKPLIPVDTDFTPAPRTIDLILAYAVGAYQFGSAAAVMEQVPMFVNHHQAKGTLHADWQAAFRTWCHNKLKWADEDDRKATAPPAGSIRSAEAREMRRRGLTKPPPGGFTDAQLEKWKT